MAKHFIDVQTYYSRDPQGMVPQVKAAMAAALLAMALLWRDRLLAEHFAPGAKFAFRYALRQPKYLKRKSRLASAGAVEDGGTTDLVFTGRTRRLALASTTVQGKKESASATSQVPFYVKFRRPKPNSPNLTEEMLRLSARQSGLLTQAAGRAYDLDFRRSLVSRKVSTR